MNIVEFLLSESKKKRKKKAHRYCRKCGCFHGFSSGCFGFGFGWGGHHDTDHAGSSEYTGDTYGSGSDSGDSGGDGGSGGE